MASSRCTYDVVVRNFNPTLGRSDFRSTFDQAGPVWDVHVPRQQFSGASSVAYIRYAQESEAEKAVELLHGSDFQGNRISVVRTAPRQNRSERNRSSEGGHLRSSTNNGRQFGETADANNGSRGGSSPGMARSGSGGSSEQASTSFQAMVVHVDEDMLVWAQVHQYGAAEELDSMVANLQKACRDPTPASNVQVGQMYAGLYLSDGLWYRCQVIAVQGPNVLVRYVDFGNCELLQDKHLQTLSKELADKPFMAKQFLLTGIPQRPIPKDTLERVRALVQERDMRVVVDTPASGTRPPAVSLKLTNKEDVSSRILQLLREAGVDLTEKEAVGSSAQKDVASPQQSTGTRSSNRGDRDAELEEKVRNLSDSFKKEQAQKKQVETQLADLKKSPFDWRVSQLSSRLSELHHIRSTVPSSSSTNDVLQKAIAAATEDNPCLTPTLDAVQKAENEYDTLQASLQGMSPDDAFDDTVTKRNEARRVFHTAASTFLDESAQLPIVEHVSRLEQNIGDMTKSERARHPGGYSPSKEKSEAELGPLIEQYGKWREERVQQVAAVQADTDACYAQLVDGFQLLQACLSQPGESPAQCPKDLDKLARATDEAVEAEVAHTKKSEQDCSQPGCILDDVSTALLEKIKVELVLVQNIQAQQGHFAQKRSELESWLETESPDTSGLEETDTIVKGLRKQLRHKATEISDANDDDKDTTKAEEEAKEIRLALHSAFNKFDKERAKLVCLLDQFPELPLRYPKADLLAYRSSQGLVKAGRIIDHYRAELDSSTTTVPTYTSIYAGTSCIVREHTTIASSVAATQQRIVDFATTRHPCLLRTDAVFNVSPKVYSQHPGYASATFNDWLAAKPSFYEQFGVVTGILSALGELHSAGKVYGPLSASRVQLVRTDEETAHPILMPVAFGAKGNLLSPSSAPEMANGRSPSTASDMYDFGMLLLSVFYPKCTAIRHRQGGIPANLPNELPSLSGLLRHVLHSKANMRWNAVQTMNAEFFRTPPQKPASSVLLNMTLSPVSSSELFNVCSLYPVPEKDEPQEEAFLPADRHFWARFVSTASAFARAIRPEVRRKLLAACVVEPPPAAAAPSDAEDATPDAETGDSAAAAADASVAVDAAADVTVAVDAAAGASTSVDERGSDGESEDEHDAGTAPPGHVSAESADSGVEPSSSSEILEPAGMAIPSPATTGSEPQAEEEQQGTDDDDLPPLMDATPPGDGVPISSMGSDV